MADSNNYVDLQSWPFSPFTPGTIQELINAPYSFDFDDSSSTVSGRNPSNTSSSDSSTQLTFDLGSVSMSEVENAVDAIDLLLPTLNTNFSLPNPPNTLPAETPIGQYDNEILRIIAEPKAFYRGRYISEVDNGKSRPNRFIRAENKDKKHIYPTIKIPAQWRDPTRYYIRVTLVTVTSDTIPHHYIHPHEISTPDDNVTDDLPNNSLYFGINQKEAISGEKSFRLIVKKKKQDDLKSYGPMRLFDHGQSHTQHVQNLQDVKQIIATYQLRKSQLVFTVAERYNKKLLLVPIHYTSVQSQIMTDVEADARTSLIDRSNDTFAKRIKCIPQKADWQGGDEVVIIMPYPIKQKVYTISFDFGAYGQQPAHEMTYIDRKTILFRTPPCPLLPGDENLKISIIITENNLPFPPIDFSYINPIRTTRNTCSRCQGTVVNNHIRNKRRCDYFENDGIDQLVSQTNELSLEQKSDVCRPRLSSDETISKFEKYLNQLKDALAIFVRTNDPSRLFRRTRTLLSDYSGNPPPLNAAIEQGHIQLALSLIEQVMDMPSSNGLLEKANENGETPLLVAAKCNQWTLIKPILEKRSDLAEQKDKDDNNLLHLLANLNEDKGAETIGNVLAIISNEMKMNLLKEENKTGQTPAKVAQSHENISCFELLSDVANYA